ncbi:MAG: hypothetical protein LBV00_06850 [Propionibacteriaceae bacterium]|nr:hypothetical protein [Propionibacteriaceae bacterium]
MRKPLSQSGSSPPPSRLVAAAMAVAIGVPLLGLVSAVGTPAVGAPVTRRPAADMPAFGTLTMPVTGTPRDEMSVPSTASSRRRLRQRVPT